ncbi:MAG: 50S ribosomal protein L18e [Candidatus Bathyarchaeia archaeon]
MKQTKSTNPELLAAIRLLKKAAKENKARIWSRIAELLSKPRRKRIAVNVSQLNRHTEKGETVVVPGKVLGTGNIDHAINVAAFAFTESARLKILKAKGKCLDFSDLIKKNPKGSKVKIIR